MVASIHWGDNWGYAIPEDHRRFAHGLIDEAAVDVVHGHSSHHAKGIEVYRGKLILYGCGDFINDYEGIAGHAEFRDDLPLMYVGAVDPDTGALARLEIVPFRMRRFRLETAPGHDVEWLRSMFSREGAAFGTRVAHGEQGSLVLQW